MVCGLSANGELPRLAGRLSSQARHSSCRRSKAATAATAEITSAVIATSLVLVAVFVPVAFFPGTTGILFRQFALTIAFSIAISAFNALTLAPALAAIFLAGSHGQKWWWLRKFDQGVGAMTRGYRAVLHHVLDLSLIHI